MSSLSLGDMRKELQFKANVALQNTAEDPYPPLRHSPSRRFFKHDYSPFTAVTRTLPAVT